jgi:hypothetical protein
MACPSALSEQIISAMSAYMSVLHLSFPALFATPFLQKFRKNKKVVNLPNFRFEENVARNSFL